MKYLYCKSCDTYVGGMDCSCGWQQEVDLQDEYVTRDEYNHLLEMYKELKYRLDGLEK